MGHGFERELTSLQLALLRILWDEGEATVNQVRKRMAEHRPLARTTVATVLARLEERGVVAHRKEGREHLYRARVSEEKVRGQRLDHLTEALFGGDVPALVSHLLDTRELDPSHLADVRRLIRAKEAELRKPKEAELRKPSGDEPC